MISDAFQNLLLENKEHFLIPGEMVASVQENNSLEHAFILLTTVKYSSIPVLDNHSKFKGMLTMPLITETMLGLDHLSFDNLRKMTVQDVMKKDVVTIKDPYDIEETLHLLVDHPYLPVLSDDGEFTGIVTRREMMKSFNRVAHNIEKEYRIEALPIEKQQD